MVHSMHLNIFAKSRILTRQVPLSLNMRLFTKIRSLSLKIKRHLFFKDRLLLSVKYLFLV